LKHTTTKYFLAPLEGSGTHVPLPFFPWSAHNGVSRIVRQQRKDTAAMEYQVPLHGGPFARKQHKLRLDPAQQAAQAPLLRFPADEMRHVEGLPLSEGQRYAIYRLVHTDKGWCYAYEGVECCDS
jgi:hypothetical protein